MAFFITNKALIRQEILINAYQIDGGI